MAPSKHPAGMRGSSSEIWGWLMSAQEEERKAISRELHDSVVQWLTTLVWDVGSLRRRIPESDTKAYEILDSIQGSHKVLPPRFAIWPCCCDPQCWTI